MRDDAVLGRALPLDRGLGPKVQGKDRYAGRSILPHVTTLTNEDGKDMTNFNIRDLQSGNNVHGRPQFCHTTE